jgi:hypothetical protein
MGIEDFEIDLSKTPLSEIQRLYDKDGKLIGDKPIRCSKTDPTTYDDPNTQFLEMTGNSIGSQIGTRFGLKGTIVPRSTRWGRSQAPFNPHKAGVIIVDPHLPDKFSIDLGILNNAAVERAQEIVREKVGDPQNEEESQIINSATLQLAGKIAAQQPANQGRTPAVAEQPNGTIPGRLMTAFGEQPPQSAQEGAPAQPASTRLLPQMNQVGPPTEEVLFDLGPMGDGSCSYHTVVVQRSKKGDAEFVILGIDERWPGMKQFPVAPSTFALGVPSLGRLFLVESTGAKFSHKGEIICIYGVNKETDLPKM